MFERMDARFLSSLGLKKPLSHPGDHKPINGQEDIKWKTKRQGESDKADQWPKKNTPALDEGGTLKKIREKN